MRPGEGISRGSRSALRRRLCSARGTKQPTSSSLSRVAASWRSHFDSWMPMLMLPSCPERRWRETFDSWVTLRSSARSEHTPPLVIDALKTAGHAVAMVTGDALLMALHVVNNSCFADPVKPSLLLRCRGDESPCWTVATGDRRGEAGTARHDRGAGPVVQPCGHRGRLGGLLRMSGTI